MASSAPVASKRPSWKDDAAAWVGEARKDPLVAAEMDAQKAAREAEAAASKKRAEEVAKRCAEFHVWRAATPYVQMRVQTSAGVRGGERGWEKEPTTALKTVANKETCPCCGGGLLRQERSW